MLSSNTLTLITTSPIYENINTNTRKNERDSQKRRFSLDTESKYYKTPQLSCGETHRCSQDQRVTEKCNSHHSGQFSLFHCPFKHTTERVDCCCPAVALGCFQKNVKVQSPGALVSVPFWGVSVACNVFPSPTCRECRGRRH